MAGNPAPASPFATAQEDDFTFSDSCASQRGAAQPDLPGMGSASTQPGTSPGQDSLFALRQEESSASQQQEPQREESPTRSSSSGQVATQPGERRLSLTMPCMLSGGSSSSSRRRSGTLQGRVRPLRRS